MLSLLSLKTLTISRLDPQVEVTITQGVNLMCMKLMESARIGELPKGKVGPLAQLVEQRTFNPWVDGSSPSGPTISNSLERIAIRHEFKKVRLE